MAEALAATTPAATPAKWIPDAERLRFALEAAWQIEGLLDLVIDSPIKQSDHLGVLSAVIRCKALSGAVMSAVDDEGVEVDDLHLIVHGTYRATEGAAA